MMTRNLQNNDTQLGTLAAISILYLSPVIINKNRIDWSVNDLN